MESIPEDIINTYYLYSIDGGFIAKAQYGDIIVSLTKRDSEEHTFIHTIHVKSDAKMCATGKTVWRKIER